MNIKSRLQIYPSKDTKDRAVIVGEKQALKALAQTILQAADSPSGFQSITLFKGNGHDYQILVTKNIDEEEWQNMPTESDNIDSIKLYDEIRSSLNKNKERVV
jgi:hypothetical protein